MTIEETKVLASRLRLAVERLPLSPRDENEQRLRDALAAAADRLKFVLERTPSAFIPETWLVGVQGAFDPVIASVEARAETEDADLTVSWAEVDRLWGAIAWFLPAIVPEESVSEDAAAYRRSAGQLIRRLTDEVSAARADLASFQQRLDALLTERKNEMETLQEVQQALRQTITAQEASLDEALKNHESAFGEAQGEYRASHEAELERTRQALQAALEEGTKGLEIAVQNGEEAVAGAVQRIGVLEEKALKSYNTIGTASVAGYYQSHANAEKKQADLWRWIAVAVFAVAAIGVLVELILRGGTIEWSDTRSRLLLVVPLGALAAFATAEARAHRRAERESRRREVELSSLDPYLVLIEDPKQADQIKLAYARRVFVDNGAESRDASAARLAVGQHPQTVDEP